MSTRRQQSRIPIVDMIWPRCPTCGQPIERFNGGTRVYEYANGTKLKVRSTSCAVCGERVKVFCR